MVFDPSRPPVPATLRLALGGTLRTAPEDFVVEEIPLYDPSGTGEHVLFEVEKRGLTTPAMLDRVARALGQRSRDLGCAGYKDRHAVTRQWVSVSGVEVDAVLGLALPGIHVLRAARHGNKLRLGHLRGNRFTVRVRDPDPSVSPDAVAAVLRDLSRRGLPNGFGPQRFGSRLDNHRFGAALVAGAVDAFFELLATPVPGVETPRIMEGRAALAARDWDAAARLFPREFAVERHVALAMRKTRDPERALRTLPPRARDFLVSAWQSMMFNRVLERRLDGYDRLLAGDVAMKHENGACFVVEDLAAEAPRAARQEISPTGPLPGLKLLRPRDEAGAIEDAVLGEAEGPSDASLVPAAALRGVRRPLRVPLTEASVVALAPGDDLELRFVLPRGSFATTLLAVLGVGSDPEG